MTLPIMFEDSWNYNTGSTFQPVYFKYEKENAPGLIDIMTAAFDD